MNFFTESLKIKNIEIPRFISGPLDGITDSPFRQLVRDYSKQELLYTEMRHVRSLITPRGGALALDFKQFERPLNFQVSASGIEYIEPACEKIIAAGVDMIDLNVGCPARNVVGSCCGSALMGNPVLLEKILKEFRRVVPDHIPFTIKIRAGFKIQNAVYIAQLAQDCGVDALAIHPRLQTQKFMGQPNYALAAEVKKALTIPVLLSGNVVNFKTAKLAHEITGVDGFLIGRGMWAKPWKLEEMKQHALGNPFDVSSRMVLEVALKHLKLMVDHYGIQGLYRFRKHLPFYVKGQPEAGILRSRLVQSNNFDEVALGLQEFLES